MKRLLDVKSHYRKVKDFYMRYERLLMPATLVVGFLVDYITFTNIRVAITLSVLFFYWAAAGTLIAFSHAYDAQKISQRFRYVRLFAPLALQFLFGALFGGSLVFYWFSGALSVSWPFIALIAILAVFNDAFRDYMVRPAVHMGVYFFITISLFSLALPFAFNSISPWLFVAAGISSAVIFSGYVMLLSRTGGYLAQKRTSVFLTMAIILAVMNLFYFFDIIPPIPLAIREAGVFHDVKHASGKYSLVAEKENFWQKVTPGQIVHLTAGERAYAYSAIFAPAKLHTTIVHIWKRYDEEKKEWMSVATLPFSIAGGQKEGYKGYSWIHSPPSGKWRVYVETKRGQTLGRIEFSVERVQEKVELEELIR